jgi:hypothetical protein
MLNERPFVGLEQPLIATPVLMSSEHLDGIKITAANIPSTIDSWLSQ